MEELAEKLKVPLDSIDDHTKGLLKNLSLQLGMVARQTAVTESSIPPELRPGSGTSVPPELRGGSGTSVPPEFRGGSGTSVPPELRGGSGTSIPPDLRGGSGTSVPPELRLGNQPPVLSSNPGEAKPVGRQHHRDDRPSGDAQSKLTAKPAAGMRRSTSGGSSRSAALLPEPEEEEYCTSYPPPDMRDDDKETVKAAAGTTGSTLQIDYGHGRPKPAVTSEDILSSLQSDIGPTHGRGDEYQPSNDKIQSYGGAPRIDTQQTGNGFVPRPRAPAPPIRPSLGAPVQPFNIRPNLLQRPVNRSQLGTAGRKW